MKALLINMLQSVALQGGKTGFCDGDGDNLTEYSVRLSAKASAMVADGDVICYADYGQSEWCVQPCRGVIYSPATGKIVALQGSRDTGAHTGHPAHLGLQMRRVWRVVTLMSGTRIIEKVTTDVPMVTNLAELGDYADRSPSEIPFSYFPLWH